MRRVFSAIVAALAWSAAQPAMAMPYYDAAVLADNPVAYYPFDETSGSTATDATGHGHGGSYVGGVTLGQVSAFAGLGTAVRFDGSTGRVRIPDNVAFDLGTGNYTIETWYTTGSGGRGDIFTYKGSGGDLGVHSASQGSGVISLYHNGFVVTSPAVPLNAWHHLVITRSSTATNGVALYIDGVQRTTGTDTLTWNIANDLLIGANHTGDPANIAAPFSGSLDAFAIYGAALTQAQVINHYSAAAGWSGRRIGINFVGGGGPGNGQTRTLANTDGWAGVVGQLNWNNATGASGTLGGLVDYVGDTTPASITWAGTTTYSTGVGSSTANRILMNGYVDIFDNQTGTFTISGIPYGQYDVYVYTDSDGSDSRDESLRVLANSLDYGTVYVSDESNFAGLFQRATATALNGSGAQGNYVCFENVIGSTFTLEATARNMRAFINGIQIVEVPEPASLTLLALGLLALARRRRRTVQ